MRVGRLSQLATLGAGSRRTPSFRHFMQRPVDMLARVLAVPSSARVARVLFESGARAEAGPRDQRSFGIGESSGVRTLTPSMIILSRECKCLDQAARSCAARADWPCLGDDRTRFSRARRPPQCRCARPDASDEAQGKKLAIGGRMVRGSRGSEAGRAVARSSAGSVNSSGRALMKAQRQSLEKRPHEDALIVAEQTARCP